MEKLCQVVVDISLSANIINELLEMVKKYENICSIIIKKGVWSMKDNIEYENAKAILDRCDDELEILGYFDSVR